METCRAITAIEGELKQLNNFYEDFKKIDEYVKYDKEHQELLEDLTRLRAKFSILYSKILTEYPELKDELNPENTEIDGLKMDLEKILEEQKTIKQYECNFHNHYAEINLLKHSTKILLDQYKYVRNNIRWDEDEVYLMLDDEPLDRRSLYCVKTEDLANELITYDDWYIGYQPLSIANRKDVYEEIYDAIINKLPNDIYEKYCKKCIKMDCCNCQIPQYRDDR